MCDQALALDPNSTKALMQRAKAKAKLSNFDDARADISRAKEVALTSTSSLAGDGEQLVERLDKQLEDITRLEQRHKYSLQQQRKFQKKMMREAVGKLYGDKKEVSRPLVAATPDCSSSPTSNSSAALLSRDFWITGIAWVITMVVNIVSVFSRLFPAKWSKVKTS
ncbi:hypothetical protein BBJ28_00006312 [Nothophytophthora sp. Chile5]|nr:hypothetical protein BBJ28_00006312 [Nothophytophthora sp. Chile5]